jgi:hypothetical protein
MADEHDEKFDEKELEKREEKSHEEKSWEEKWQRDPLGSMVWAMILIWAGVVFLASNMGWLDRWVTRAIDIPGFQIFADFANAWSFVLIGAGVIIVIEVIIRLLVPAYRRPILGSLIFAVILIGIGAGDLWDWGLVWALVLIVLGVSAIMRGLMRKR